MKSYSQRVQSLMRIIIEAQDELAEVTQREFGMRNGALSPSIPVYGKQVTLYLHDVNEAYRTFIRNTERGTVE